jgi:hypothetical protein
MICSIGGFVFEAHDVTGLGMGARAHFGEYKPYGDDPHYHNTQGSTKSITVSGRYIASSNSRPQILEGILKSKSPTRFTMATGESERVIVTDFHTQRKDFVNHSGAVSIDFTVTLKRVSGGGFGIFSILGGILAALV